MSTEATGFPTGAEYHIEFARSREFFTDPSSYDRFDLTQDKNRMISCIDPRDEDRDDVKITIQTPGAGVGEGHDAALTLTAIKNQLVTIEEGLAKEKAARRVTSLGAHHACRFNEGLIDVLLEESDPSDFTLDAIERWTRYYQLDDFVKPRLQSLSDAAQAQHDYIQAYGTDDLVAMVDRLWPTHANVTHMRGENRARLYIINHHPHLGLDRHKAHRERQIVVQGYHDSLRAAVDDLNNTYNLTLEARGLRLAALFLRSAATRTVLGTLHDDTEYYSLIPTDRGPQIQAMPSHI